MLFLAQLGILAFWFGRGGWSADAMRATIRKSTRRFSKFLPLSFVVMCVLNFLGGALNEISNGDSIAYRITRAQHWLSESGWHWIHTGDERMNVVGCNYEWLSTPILLFLPDDRWIFLVSLSAYFLLPALFFIFLRQVRVPARAAWWWMWLLSAGWIYAMQASSVATDGFSATAALAAVVFALRAAKTKDAGDFCLSILAFGFLTGIKQLTLPLAIIWVAPTLLSWRVAFKKPLLTAACVFIATLASALPITVANIHYTGSWKGFKVNYEQASPVWGLVGNAIILPAQNFQPPLFPWADRWNDAMERFVKTPAGQRFSTFERFIQFWRAPSEINAGLGFGLSALLVISALALVKMKASRRHMVPASPLIHWVRWTPLIAIGAFMAKSALAQLARYAAPFYPFLLPLLLSRRGFADLTRQRWWRTLAYATVALTIGLLLISRQRPAWPAAAVASWLKSKYPHSSFVAKVENAFVFSRQNLRWKAEVRALIPDSEKRVGYSATWGLKERTLWQVSPGRKVFRINLDDDRAYALSLGVDYVLVEATAVEVTPGQSIESWLEQFPGTVVGKMEGRTLPDAPPEISYVVRLKR